MSKQTKMLTAIRGVDRKQHFANGGSLVAWMGGPHTVRRNRKKYTRKTKHRR